MNKYIPWIAFIIIAGVASIGVFVEIPLESFLKGFGVFLMTVIVTAFLFPDMYFVNLKKKCAQMLKTMLESNPKMGMADFKRICEFYKLNNSEIETILLELFSERLQNNTSGEVLDQLRLKLDSIKREEPFIKLPESIKLYIGRIDDATGRSNENVRLLATALSDFIIKADRQHKWDRMLSKLGFIIGLIGAIIPFLVK